MPPDGPTEAPEQLALDLEPKPARDPLAEFVAYRNSRTKADPYDPRHAPIPY